MKVLLITLFFSCSVFSKWEKIDVPKSLRGFSEIKTGSDFIVGKSGGLYFSFDGGKIWEIRNNGLDSLRSSIDKVVIEKDIIFFKTQTTYSDPNGFLYYSTNTP